MFNSSDDSRTPEIVLFGYTPTAETQLVISAELVHVELLVVMTLFSIGIVAFKGLEGIAATLFLWGMYCLLANIPRLVLVALEKQAIVLIRRLPFRRNVRISIPISEILRIERGNSYFPTDLTVVQKGNFFHEISLITKGRGAGPRFRYLVNQTSIEIPGDPRTHPVEISDAFCSLLSEAGVRIQVDATSACDHIAWNILRPWRPRKKRQ